MNATPGLVVQSDNAVVCNTTFTNNSDASLKTDVISVSTTQAIEVLKAVEPKVYRRTDLPGDAARIGFIAQDFQGALSNTPWTNIVGHNEAADEYVDEDGNTVPAKPSTLTLDYARLNCVLWECCRSLLARLEHLEARLE